VKYAWIQQNHSYWPISARCQVLDVSESGYYHHWTRGTARHRIPDDALLTYIRAIHREVKGEYGWPRMWKSLQARGIKVNKERVRQMMKQYGIQARGKRKFVVTTDSKHSLPIAPNLLQRNFTTAAPNQVWTGDITYIQTDEGWLYLAVVLDLFSRQVVGSSMQKHIRSSLVTDA
jgi:putative transposase